MHPRKLLRIARWELATATGTLDRRTVAVLVLAVAATGLVGPALVGGSGTGLDHGIYQVAVEEDHPYHDAITAPEQRSLRVVDDAAGADVVVSGVRSRSTDGDERVHVRLEPDSTPKGEAAVAEIRDAVEAYNYRQLRGETDQAAAFPVVVTVDYAEQPGKTMTLDASSTGDGGGDDGGTGGTSDGVSDDTSDGSAADGSGSDTSGDGQTGTDGSTGDGVDLPADGSGEDADDGNRLGIPDIGGALGGDQHGSPADISPPFPFGSLVLAFLFVIPLNFVIQAYGATIMDERLNRRGELLLVSPVSAVDVVAGKTLPYFLSMLAVTSVIAGGLAVLGDAGPLSVLAVAPVATLFLGATFAAAMFARSYKELTFLTVTISVFLTTYVFVPAIFTDVTPIALISPLTLVVMDLQGVTPSTGDVLFATGPFLLASTVLFGLGIGVYREEDMFTQRPVHRKAFDALAAWIHRPWQVAATSAALLPLVFVLQLLIVAILFALPETVSLPVLMVLIALVEEVAKSVHLYAAYEHDRFDRSWGTALVLGTASGVGFFAGEKVFHVLQLQLVGLENIQEGMLAFTPETGVHPLLGLGLFLAPLALHCVTAAISALGARRDANWYAAAVCVAIFVHAAYNLGVVALVT